MSKVCLSLCGLKAREIDLVFTEGRWLTRPQDPIKILFRTAPALRYCIISRKRLGKAVVRNHLRRQVREILRSGLTVWRGDLVLQLTPAWTSLDFQDKKEWIGKALNKTRVPKN